MGIFAGSRLRAIQWKLGTDPMDASEPPKARKSDSRQLEAREARLAKALRANLRRRKAPDAPGPPPPAPGESEGKD
jgi:hypothetical protein